MDKLDKKTACAKKVVIIGSGSDCYHLTDLLRGSSLVKVVAITDTMGTNEPTLVKELNIPVFDDYRVMLEKVEHDFIFDITNNELISNNLEMNKSEDFNIITGASASLICELIEEKKKRREETQRRLSNFEELYRFGLTLSSSQDLGEVNDTIVEFATKITNCPSGSLAVLDEKTGEMVLCASKGFSSDFHMVKRWKLRPGGLTSHILNQKLPVVISDMEKYKSFNNQLLLDEKIKSIIAAPLTVEGRIIGILYVDDFIERKFSSDDIYSLSLISTYAALAIERTKLLEDTKLMAITDGLTGLLNQKTFFQRLDEEIERAVRYNHPLSLITFDIDFFKNYNDSQGHLVGNEALVKISKSIKDQIRQIDIFARTGGEEFTLIIPETDKKEAHAFAERMRKSVEESTFKGEEGQPEKSLTISVGVAGLPSDSHDGLDLMDKADQAMYEAKHEGRNRVKSYEPGLISQGSTCEWRLPHNLTDDLLL